MSNERIINIVAVACHHVIDNVQARNYSSTYIDSSDVPLDIVGVVWEIVIEVEKVTDKREIEKTMLGDKKYRKKL